MLQYLRLTCKDSPYFDEAWQLYVCAFPPAERRTIACHLDAMMQEPDFHCLAFYDDSGFAALLFYWVLADCVYVEHLAVAESRRGQGLGKSALAFAQQHGLPVFLEIEPVVDAPTAARLRFYESIGYHRLPFEHVQLPYQHNQHPLRLDLLSYPFAESADSVKVFEQAYLNGPMRYRESRS